MVEELNTLTKLYLIEILHQTTTLSVLPAMSFRCILSKFYIKPQHGRRTKHSNKVVSYRNSTSNHNERGRASHSGLLYLIEILHQTTTIHAADAEYAELYLIEILHQTTTRESAEYGRAGCILSKFYIKPQPSSKEYTTR